MPKKRHQALYSKPQSTPPASLASGSASSRDSASGQTAQARDRSVNELLANSRRAGLIARAQQQQQDVQSTAWAPTVLVPQGGGVPRIVGQTLLLPGQPNPLLPAGAVLPPGGLPARPGRGQRWRRPPPGPPPPRSWLAQSRHAPPTPRQQRELAQPGREAAVAATGVRRDGGLPDMRLPSRGTLIDIVLRKLVADWEFHQLYNRYHFYALPSHLRECLIAYLTTQGAHGVTQADLQLILTAPPELQDEVDPAVRDATSLNDDVTCLDLTSSVGRSISLRELTSCLFPSRAKDGPAAVLDSWDASEDVSSSSNIREATVGLPRTLLPNLTHLSLALDLTSSLDADRNPHAAAATTTSPGSVAATVSWRHLLSLAAHLPTLTHLSLAHWPEPSLTPNAKFASVVSPHTGRRLPYGGTGPYSHSLDADWSEAVLVLRRLSRLLYGLEWLDLTACGAWAPALMVAADRDAVDWVGDWGKVTTVVLRRGEGAGEYSSSAALALIESDSREGGGSGLAKSIEKHIREQRAGKGRRIDVER